MDKKYLDYFEKLQVRHPDKFRLADWETSVDLKPLSKKEGLDLLEEGIEGLSAMQERLYAHDRYGVLIIFQAMDSAGKDGAIKHVMSGLNPQGVKVHSFKAPTPEELDQDFFWRHSRVLPGRGEIGIFNRSYYENVLVTRVHPTLILRERLPGLHRLEDITEDFWEDRLKQIRRYERNRIANGTVIIKFFLHLSREEQRHRFLERIDNPAKNWKFSLSDIAERGHWEDYQRAYEQAIAATSTPDAPWYVIPADDKWFARLSIAAIITARLQRLEVEWPRLDDGRKAQLLEARQKLMGER